MINPQTFQLPEQLSTGAAEVDDLYMIVFWFSVVFTAIIAFCIVYFAWEYRRRPGVKAAPVGHMLTLELAWTIIPLILVVIPFHYGFKVYVHNAVAAEGATEIRVRAEKWKWEFQYPNGMRENGLLRIPINKPVKFVISSEDVLHSFYVPGARLKKDAVPGRGDLARDRDGGRIHDRCLALPSVPPALCRRPNGAGNVAVLRGRGAARNHRRRLSIVLPNQWAWIPSRPRSRAAYFTASGVP
jgi:hypothetical protein